MTYNQNEGQKILATPFAKAMAAKLNVDLSQVKPSGEGNKILVKDIENYASQKPNSTRSQSQPQSVSPSQRVDNIALTPMRKAIAKAMKNSWSNVAYTNLVTEVNMTKLWDDRKTYVNDITEMTGVKITFLPFIIKAIAVALQEFPKFNAKLNEANSTLDVASDYNIGIAVDTPKGLVVPVVKNANALSILQLAQEVKKLAIAARDQKLTRDQMSQGTFTISNYGSVGALYGIPVINYPELAIAGIGAIIDKIYVQDKQLVPGKVMHLTVAADHRWIDGAEIGRFMQKIKFLLENPGVLGLY